MISGGSTDSIYVCLGMLHIKEIRQTFQVMVDHKHIYIIEHCDDWNHWHWTLNKDNKT